MDTLKIVNFLTVRKHCYEKKQNNITVFNNLCVGWVIEMRNAANGDDIDSDLLFFIIFR